GSGVCHDAVETEEPSRQAPQGPCRRDAIEELSERSHPSDPRDVHAGPAPGPVPLRDVAEGGDSDVARWRRQDHGANRALTAKLEPSDLVLDLVERHPVAGAWIREAAQRDGAPPRFQVLDQERAHIV